MELRRKISFGLGYAAPQRNEPVLEAANFTFLRGWAKIANHLVANLLSFHTLVTMTKAVQQLIEEGHPLDMEALSTLSPYRTEHINRFGNYVINPDRLPEPLEQHLVFSLSPIST